MIPLLALVACTCAGVPGGPGGLDTGAETGSGRPDPWSDGPSFWDLEPDTGWMADYPVVDCPWPDEDDYVVELDVYGAVIDFYRFEGDPRALVRYLLYFYGFAETGGVCSEYQEIQDEWEDHKQDGIKIFFSMYQVFHGPGTSEGLHYLGVRDSVGVDTVIDGQWDSHVQPYPTYDFSGRVPYRDFCLVRVRPHRVAGMLKFELPPVLAEEYGWPEQFWNGLYLWWDWSWGEGGPYAEHQYPSCLTVLYENLSSPQEAWPDMPEGWSHEDTVP